MVRQLSLRTPKGWSRQLINVDRAAEKMLEAFGSLISTGTVIEIAIFNDRFKRLRRVDILFDSGWIARASFNAEGDGQGYIEEFAPPMRFEIRF